MKAIACILVMTLLFAPAISTACGLQTAQYNGNNVRHLSLPKTPSWQKLTAHLAQWSCEIVAMKSGFSDWIKGDMVSSGSIFNLGRITPR